MRWPPRDDRICLIDAAAGNGAWVTSIDVTQERQVWRVRAADDATTIQAIGGGIVIGTPAEQTLLNADGQRLTATSGRLGWIDDTSLVNLPVRAGDTITRTLPDTGAHCALGPMPAADFSCAWTADRLVCPGRSSVRVWKMPS